MNKKEFKVRWESNDEGGGITFDEIALCASAWGVIARPMTKPMDEVTYAVLKAAGAEDAESYKPNSCHEDRAMTTKTQLPQGSEGPEHFIDVVFDGPPSHDSGRLVEAEDESGKSIKFVNWVLRHDGYWVLRIPLDRVRKLEKVLKLVVLLNALEWTEAKGTDDIEPCYHAREELDTLLAELKEVENK